MKNTLLKIVALLVGGCASTSALEEKIVGEYVFEGNENGKSIFLENGIMEAYQNGKKEQEFKWKLVGNEVHLENSVIRGTGVLGINPDDSLTLIGKIIDEVRRDAPKDKQRTIKKIK